MPLKDQKCFDSPVIHALLARSWNNQIHAYGVEKYTTYYPRSALIRNSQCQDFLASPQEALELLAPYISNNSNKIDLSIINLGKMDVGYRLVQFLQVRHRALPRVASSGPRADQWSLDFAHCWEPFPCPRQSGAELKKLRRIEFNRRIGTHPLKRVHLIVLAPDQSTPLVYERRRAPKPKHSTGREGCKNFIRRRDAFNFGLTSREVRTITMPIGEGHHPTEVKAKHHIPPSFKSPRGLSCHTSKRRRYPTVGFNKTPYGLHRLLKSPQRILEGIDVHGLDCV
jgi:hypothetical protein